MPTDQLKMPYLLPPDLKEVEPTLPHNTYKTKQIMTQLTSPVLSDAYTKHDSRQMATTFPDRLLTSTILT